jgi:metallo-beta-lactamase family protein
LSKHKEKIKVKFIGSNSTGVTGSIIYIEYKDKKMLLDCGLYQEGTVLENYQINKEAFKSFKPSGIDYCFILHSHIDHSGNLCQLIKYGFTGKIITTSTTAKLLKPLLLDSAHIHLSDAKYISKKKDREYEPLYTEDDVYETLDYIYEYGYDEIYKLDDVVSFRFLHNSHILGAAQLELIITKEAGNKETVFYSSDIGNISVHKPLVDEMEYVEKAGLAIFESTYGLSERSFGKKDREKDIDKIKTLIRDTVIENKGRLLIPCFSMDRSQHLMYVLHELFQDRSSLELLIVDLYFL